MNELAAFSKLSNELCICIFEQLPRSALNRTSKVCRRFRIICIPILFHTIDASIHHYEPRIVERSPRLTQRYPDNAHKIAVTQYLFM
jgi:hypothetical protein